MTLKTKVDLKQKKMIKVYDIDLDRVGVVKILGLSEPASMLHLKVNNFNLEFLLNEKCYKHNSDLMISACIQRST